MSARKLWATSYPRVPGSQKRRHESKAAVYRYVNNEVANWLAGALRSQHLVVWVDERTGMGWERYENVDLATWGS
jgi:hypothetical protein